MEKRKSASWAHDCRLLRRDDSRASSTLSSPIIYSTSVLGDTVINWKKMWQWFLTFLLSSELVQRDNNRWCIVTKMTLRLVREARGCWTYMVFAIGRMLFACRICGTRTMCWYMHKRCPREIGCSREMRILSASAKLFSFIFTFTFVFLFVVDAERG